MNEQMSKKEKVKFLTLGCRLNQYETQAIRENFLKRGYAEADKNESTDIFVINTRTVTAESDKESRYLIRKCHRENPDAKVIVTGCYVERDQKTVSSLPGVTHVVLNRQKSDIVNLLESCTSLSLDQANVPIRSKTEYTPLNISGFSGRTRAHIKIQDGCNHACSFCKVVLVRGKSRSRTLQEIIEEAKRLRDNGYSEIVLTGIQLGAYGLDLEYRLRLTQVLEALAPIDGIERIRLSSIEPLDVTDDLIDSIRSIPKVCHHLHIPLQSGSDKILKAMNRRYTRGQYLDLIEKLNQELENFILTADVMTGFPGELDTDFEETVDLLLSARPFKMHIFPYSSREGTRASRLTPVSQEVVQKRMSVLFELETKLRHEVALPYIGKELSILIENSPKSEQLEGRAFNYLPVRIPKPAPHEAGDFVDVRIVDVEDEYLVGEKCLAAV